jgi:RHS repeat-associated protein
MATRQSWLRRLTAHVLVFSFIADPFTLAHLQAVSAPWDGVAAGRLAAAPIAPIPTTAAAGAKGTPTDRDGSRRKVATSMIAPTIEAAGSDEKAANCAEDLTEHRAPLVSLAKTLLWPPNHPLVDVGLGVDVTVPCEGRVTTRVAVFADEPDEDQTGDGNVPGDARIDGTNLFLRSERKGDADGRVYLVLTTSTLPDGTAGAACATVVVPKSRSQADLASVRTLASTAQAYCEAHQAAPPSYFKLTEGVLTLANAPPVVDAGPDQAVDFPGPATLHGTATDDGRPNGTLAVSWSKVDGPAGATVTFSSSGTAETTATFSASGTYTLRLTADDGQLTASDDAVVVVAIANEAPLVDAGPDQEITLPENRVTLDGSASDDGRPAGSRLITTWSVLSPAGAAVTFADPHAPQTTATLPGAGEYVLRLTANDGQFAVSDDVRVTVHAQPPPILSIADAAVPEGNEGTTAAVVTLALSYDWPQPVTVDYLTEDGTAVAGCDYRTSFGKVTFAPGQTTAEILVPIAGELAPEADETVRILLDNVSQATLERTEATLTIRNDDAANAPLGALSNRAPADRANSVALPPTLTWSAVDPDAGDVLTHDVQLGASFATSGQSWARTCPASSGPGPRTAPVAGYDEAGDRLILFGGTGSTDGSLWILDNASAAGGPSQWTSIPTASGPVGLGHAASAYDAATNRLFVVGGCTGDCQQGSDQTWILTNANGLGGTPTWSLLAGATLSPRIDHAAAIDPTARRLIVFGGSNAGSPLGDVWLLNLDGQPAWQALTTSGAGPARSGMTASYDPERNVLVVFGGRAGTSALSDTWVLSNANGSGGSAVWSRLAPSGTPPPGRWGHVAAYDPVAARLVIYGGSTASANPATRFVFRDVWMLTNAAGASAPEWIRLSPNAGPTGQVQAAGAFSASANRLIAVGGTSSTRAATDEIWVLSDAIGTLPLVTSDSATSFTAGGLLPGALYYWRIFSRDDHGAARGSTAWRFTSNAPPTVEAGADQEIRLPVNQVSLSGTASDDGLPEGSVLTVRWSATSGPGPVVFSNPEALATTASFSVAGTYVLTLTATDGMLPVSDTLTVNVRAANEPPVVDAGPDQTVVLSSGTTQPPPFIQLVRIQTGFATPTGIDYHQPTNKVVLSVNYPSGQPYNFELVGADGSRQRFGNVVGLTDELKIATVPDEGGGLSRGGFVAGTLFSGTGTAGQILRVSADGSVVDRPWITLPGEIGLLRGSLYVDRTGVFGGDLIAVTTAGGVWRVKANGAATRLASIGTHLEGVKTIPDDPLRYGPWAGKILIGAEQQTRFYTVDPQGAVAFYELGIQPEDIEIIPADQNFFGVDQPGNSLWSIPAASFSGMVGDLLIAQEFPGILWWVRWNGARFEVSNVAQIGQWEHVTFAPAGIINVASTSGTATLHGTATDDGLPSGQLTTLWEKASGPGSVSITQPTQLTTAATFSQPGEYTLRLTASDSVLSSSDLTKVTLAANQPPVVNAGPDQSISTPGPVSLPGTVTDDGLPSGKLYAAWTKVLGPGAVSFTAPAYDPAADFSPLLNPSGPWTYGYTEAGVFKPFTIPGTTSGLPGWFRADPQSTPAPGFFPYVAANKTADTVSLPGGEFLPASTLLIKPGSSQIGVVRWTAPAAGDYFVQGVFQGMAAATSSQITVVVLGTSPILHRNINGTEAAPFFFVRHFAAGEVIELSVDPGIVRLDPDETFLTLRIATAGPVATQATFSLPGTYLLRLVANDGERTAQDDTVITIAPTACIPIATAPVGWWPGEGSFNDLGGGQPAAAQGGVGFAPGQVGQAFAFDGVDDAIVADASPRLNVASITIEGWVKLGTLSRIEPFVEYSTPGKRVGVHLWHSFRPSVGLSPGTLYANLADLNGGGHVVMSAPGALKVGEWTHVALTYDAATGRAQVYVNGGVAGFANFGSFTIQTSLPLNLGFRPAGTTDGGSTAVRFTGLLDEMAVFGRALSADEIRAIASAGPFGKCRDINQPPVVNAGPDVTATLRCDGKAIATLPGSVTDDGLPAGSTLTQTWSSLAGPAAVTFAIPNAATTDATFPAVGDYTLRLVGSDSALAVQDVAVVHVSAFLPPAGNFVASGILPSHDGLNAPAPVVVSGLTVGRTYSLYLWGSWMYGNGEIGNGATVSALVPGSTLVSGFGNPTILLIASTSPFTSTAPLVVRRFEATATSVTMAIQDLAGFYFDNTGQLFFQIYEGAPSEPLVVNAGPDQTLTQPVSSATLSGSVLDVGRPPVAGTSLLWTQVSGPSAAIVSPTSATSSVSLSLKGTYVFRLKATTCVRTAQDDVTIVIGERPDLSATSVDVSGLMVDGQTLAASGTLSAQVANGGGPAGAFDVTFFEDRNGDGVLDPSDGLLGTASVASLAAGQTATAAATVAGSVLFAGSPVRVFVDSGQAVAETNESNNYAQSRPPCTAAPPSTCDFTRPDLTASFVRKAESAGLLILTARIGNGGGSTVAAGVPVTFYDRDPATVGTQIATVTTVSALAPGQFVDVSTTVPATTLARPLWVVADDQGGLVGTVAEVNETNNAYNSRLFLSPTANTAPTVNAGADQRLAFPQRTAILDATATDEDGLPLGALTTQWSVAQRPAGSTVTFADATAVDTTATFSAAGLYALRLTADDGELSTSDDVMIVVEAANQAPVVDAGPNQSITKPTTALDGTVTDDGLPTGSVVTVQWSQLQGPGTAVFGNASAVDTTATFNKDGHYVLQLSASDSATSGSDTVTIDVAFANATPVVNAGPDRTLTLPTNSLTLNGTATDDGLPIGSTLTIKWSVVLSPGVVTFGTPSTPVTTATFSDPGVYVLKLTASDGAATASDQVQVSVGSAPATGDVPQVALSAPIDGAHVTAPTPVVGTVTSASLASWKLEYRLEGDTTYTRFAAGTTQVTAGPLGTFDPSLLLNGIYEVRLTGTDTAGRNSRTSIKVVVRDNLKVGQFSVSFVDLDVPVSGLPIQVTRTYDSRDKGKGDFGFGWRLEMSNVRLAEKGVVGLAFEGTRSSGAFPTYCLQLAQPQVVTVTLTDGTIYEFQPVLARSCQQFAPLEDATVRYQPLPGTHASLAAAGDGYVFVVGSWPGPMELYDGSTFEIYDPDEYVLTLADGTQLFLNQTTGLKQVKDLNGNTLTVSSNGITHSSGRGITFTRDAQGRITQVTDPDNHSMTYSYDAAGDLASFTDRETNTTTFTYNPDLPHFLETIRDPRGKQPIRNEYYDDGRIKSHTDAFGKTITYAHDLTGRQEVVTDRDGGVRVLVYDERGNVVKETDPEGKVVDRTFDARNNRMSETLPHDPGVPDPPKTKYFYDAQDDLRSVTDPENNTTKYTYNARKQVVLMEDPRGTYTINAYDAKGNLFSTKTSTSPTGSPVLSEVSSTYRADGNLETHTETVDGVACVTRYEYDGSGNLIKETDGLGHAMSSTYDASGNRLTQTTTRTTPAGVETLTTTYEYDKLGRLLKTTDADTTFTETVYDEVGRKKETHDKLGRVTKYSYDDMGRLVLTTYPDLTTEEATYDGEGHRLTFKDRAGRVTKYKYDTLGRLTRTTYPDETFTENVYDSAGRLKETKDARGNTTFYGYDAAGRQTSVKVPLGSGEFAETVFTYDANGNQKTVRDANLHTVTYEYDELNRQRKTIFPDGTYMETTYDALGRRRAEQDQAGKVTKFDYDCLGRLTTVTQRNGGVDLVTHYEYDEVGNRVLQRDANGHETHFEYDKLGRETARTLPDGKTETKTYWPTGSLKTRTDFMGRAMSYDYDENERLKTRTYPVGTLPAVTFTYTTTGQRKTVTVAGATTQYEYDLRDRLKTLSYPDGRTLEYDYDGNGNRTSLKATVGGQTLTTSFSYDPANRLDLVTDPASRTYDHGYDPAGNRKSLVHPNGVTTTYIYDDLNRLRNLATTHSSTGVTIQSYGFMLGPSGNRTMITEGDGTVREYGYDDLYRLISEKVTIGAIPQYDKAFTYDAVGNRKMQTTNGTGAAGTPTAPGSLTYGYDTRDRLATENGTLAGQPVGITYGYDDNGNLITKSGEATYFWDVENRLIRAETGASGSMTVVTYAYDADGNRVQTKVTPPNGPPTVINDLMDTSVSLSQVVAETDEGGRFKAYYVRGNDLLAVMRPLVPAPANPADWQTRFIHADGIGSIRRLTDESGGITDGYTYTAFGERIAHTGTDLQPYAFVGEPYDPNVGFQYHRARWMDPRVGRFAAMDPFDGIDDDPPSLHAYLYAAADVVNRKDPSGEFTLGETVVVGAVIGVLAGALAYTLTHPPSAGPDAENKFTWKGFVLWTAAGGAAGALAAYGGWYAVMYFGPPITTTIGGVTYPVSRLLAQQWANLNVLKDHFIKHGQQVAGIIRQGAYTLEQYAADAAYIRDVPMARAFNAARGAWYYVRLLGNSPSGKTMFGVVIEKGGQIVSFYPVPLSQINDFIPGFVR